MKNMLKEENFEDDEEEFMIEEETIKDSDKDRVF